MTTRPAGDPDRLVHCAIRVQGRLEPRWTDWFAGMSLTADDDGTTALHGPLHDQAALHGVLARMRDLAIPLISITTCERTVAVSAEPAHRSPERGTP
jgi:hypothetical protein